jgi:hypothetical protein
VIAGLMQRLLN